ncbi:MAG: BON domain-containing protein [Desulfobacterales bacterium]|nr:BON domain-containing protein [Desulfobacterales bacterium]
MKSDEQLQREVYEELRWDPMVNEANIRVSGKDGLVVLQGHVPHYAEKLAAKEAAMRVKGVLTAVDDIEVKLSFTDHRKDDDIVKAISSALIWSVWVPESVKVTVDRGWVTLTGEVDWEFKRKKAENIVSHVIGVRGVSNLISIKPRNSRRDETKQAIESAFRRNGRIAAGRITVEVLNGKVVLQGKVNSWAERVEAGRVAWSARGVCLVENETQVSNDAGTSARSE